MRIIKMEKIRRNLLMLLWANLTHCSVPGISYMDPIKNSSIRRKTLPGDDTCNTLYWYPRNIPEYCYFAKTERPARFDEPPVGRPAPPQTPIIVPIPPPSIPILTAPVPILPIPPPSLIAGHPAMPLFPAPPPVPLMSILPNSYPYLAVNAINDLAMHSSLNKLQYNPRSQTGFVPGMHGLVTKDGGINIMPFSDAYADMLEKHKNKLVRRKLHKILDKYKYYPYSKEYIKLRKYQNYISDK